MEAPSDTTMTQTEAHEIIATCRALWGVVHTSQFSSAGVDENALTAGIEENALTACGSKHSRTSGMSSRNGRAAELDIDIVRQGVKDKLTVVRAICEELQLTLQQVCYLGDDLPDWSVIQQVGLGVAVGDAADELKDDADYITRLPGGQGAMREVVELLLKNTNRWESVLRKYQA